MKRLFTLLTLGLILLGGYVLMQYREADYQSPDWTLARPDNSAVTLSDYQGQPVLLVFWATWCPYCKKLLPGIERLHQEYADQGLKIIAVDILEDGDPAAYMKRHDYHFDMVLEGDDIMSLYGVTGTPALIFIDADGKILGRSTTYNPADPILEAFAKSELAKSGNPSPQP